MRSHEISAVANVAAVMVFPLAFVLLAGPGCKDEGPSGSAPGSGGGGASGGGTVSDAGVDGLGGGIVPGMVTGSGGQSGGGTKIDVPPGEPVSAPDRTWKAIPVDGTQCRDRQRAGFGINTNAASDKLLIYMEGGGACFNVTTCLQSGRSWAVTDQNAGSAADKFILNRSNAMNPFRDWNLVYVPYCSGDVHTGTAISGYNGDPQTGYTNFFKYLQRVVATFKNLKQVVLSGSSAGGFGAAWNWMLVQDAFGDVPVFVLDDSGPPMTPDYLTTCQQMRLGELWGWKQSLHPACTDCNVGAGSVVIPLVETSMKRHTNTRVALLSYTEDGTIKSFFGYGLNNCAGWNALLPPAYPAGKFTMGLADLRQRWTSYPHAAMYVVAGGSHMFLGTNLSSYKTGSDITMLEWVEKFVAKADGWTSVAP
jgi:hypothetical protein